MNVSKDGLVIWSSKTGEADRVLTILTDEGLITAYARGSLRPNGRLTSACTMLSLSNFELATGKNMYTVVNAESQKKFLNIYSDAVSYALATYFCELLKLTVPYNEEAKQYLTVMLNTLYLINNGSKPLWQIKAVFEMTIMTLSGYMPNIFECAQCGALSSDKVFFEYSTGTWLCSSCSEKRGIQADVPFSVMSAIRYIVSAEPQRAFAFELRSPSKEIFCDICERYLVEHIDHDLKTLNYYHTIKD
ncbi:MAG: DNA repair protein RecO [Oscillospiraceae bacterium]|nr:DNA repair protein RecO [Oscillospiraceae bacterium]